MDIFLDTADVSLVTKYNDYGLVAGVTTNPSIIAKSGRDFKTVINDICQIVSGPVSAEVIAQDADGMLKEAKDLIQIAPNVCIKLPLTLDGLKACKILSQKGIMTNMTLCFSLPQAVLAAKAGATFVSPFVGRWDDISSNGMDLIKNIKLAFEAYNSKTKILVASVRHPVHIVEAMKIGAHVATIQPTLLEQIVSHPLTTKGLEIFMADYNKSKSNQSKS